ERQGVDPGPMPQWWTRQPPGRHSPELNGAFFQGRSKELPIPAESRDSDIARVLKRLTVRLPGARIPQPDRLVTRGSGQELPVRREAKTHHGSLMAKWRSVGSPGPCLPQLRGPILGGRSELLAIGTEHRRGNGRRVSDHLEERLAHRLAPSRPEECRRLPQTG